MNQLEALSKMTVVVADTGDINEIEKHNSQNATTNPSLILAATELPRYKKLIADAIQATKAQVGLTKEQALIYAQDKLLVNIGVEILRSMSGRVSTEVDARLSFNTAKMVMKARDLIKMYQKEGINRDRVLIKLAATWQGIKAAEVLEQEGINCNLTLLFSKAQARACAEAGVYLISPFVGRILDWYKEKYQKDYSPEEDPGVKSVKEIFEYYKKYAYDTIVMGASFRNVGEIRELAGCDYLTIAPKFLQELSDSNEVLERKLQYTGALQLRPQAMTEPEFYWEHNKDAMAVEKLAEGIRKFTEDQEKLESKLAQYLD